MTSSQASTPRIGWREALPPLLVYLAAGLSGMTNIVATFFVKEHLGLSAEFVAALGFWTTLPWTLKMAFGHLVDLLWRFRAWLVILGAALAFLASLIWLGLLVQRPAMAAWMPAEAWYVCSALLAPIGYVLQDVVADAMSVEAVPRTNARGDPVDEARSRLMHTTMQSWSRGVLIAGGLVVAVVNLWTFDELPAQSRLEAYRQIVAFSLAVPVLPILGAVLAMRHEPSRPAPRPDPLLLGGSVAFATVTLMLGLARVPHSELWVFMLSLAIIGALMRRLLGQLDDAPRRALIGTAIALFMFRAVPDLGPGPTWWQIDELRADEGFFARLSVLGSVLALVGLVALRRWMARHSVPFTIVVLALAWTVLSLPMIGLYFGLHERLGINGRAIVVLDTAALSLLGEVAMVPMLAWVARTAPDALKATYFAVMVSFTNLGFLLSRLGTEYLNRWFMIAREVRDGTGTVVTAADYSQLGPMALTHAAIVLTVPLLTVFALQRSRFRSVAPVPRSVPQSY